MFTKSTLLVIVKIVDVWFRITKSCCLSKVQSKCKRKIHFPKLVDFDTWYLLKWQTIVSTFTLLDQEVFNSCVFVFMFVQAHQHLLFGNSELKSNNFLSRATYYQSLPEGKSPDLQLTKYHAKKKLQKVNHRAVIFFALSSSISLQTFYRVVSDFCWAV